MAGINNFPAGFATGITIRGMPTALTHPGKVFWVSNSGVLSDRQISSSNNNPGSYDKPFNTIYGALTQCVANRGDIVMVKPGHAETVTAAGGIALNKAGVAIIGLGVGAKRPTITFTTANTATVTVTAANVSMQNFLFVGNFLSIAKVFDITTAKDFTVSGCEFQDVSSVLGFLSIFSTSSTANAADGLYVSNNVRSSHSTSGAAFVVIGGTTDRLYILNNLLTHDGANNNVAVCLEHGALVVTNGYVMDNVLNFVHTDTATGAFLVKTTATTGSGMAVNNKSGGLDVAGAISITAAAVQWRSVNNLYTGDTAFSGFVLPAIATD